MSKHDSKQTNNNTTPSTYSHNTNPEYILTKINSFPDTIVLQVRQRRIIIDMKDNSINNNEKVVINNITKYLYHQFIVFTDIKHDQQYVLEYVATTNKIYDATIMLSKYRGGDDSVFMYEKSVSNLCQKLAQLFDSGKYAPGTYSATQTCQDFVNDIMGENKVTQNGALLFVLQNAGENVINFVLHNKSICLIGGSIALLFLLSKNKSGK